MNKQNYGPALNSRKAVRDIYVFIFVSVIVACDVRHYSSYILSHKENQFYHFICWKICLFFTGLWCGLCWILFSYPWVSVSGFFFNLFYLFFPEPTPRYVNYYSLGFPGGSECKESACNAGDRGSIPGLGWSPGEGYGWSGLFNLFYLFFPKPAPWYVIIIA